MKMSRLVVMLLLIGDIFVFFMMQSQFDENGRWALVGSALILAIIWVFLGDTPEPQKVARRQVQTAKKPETSSDVEVDIPDVIKEDEMDGATLRERKLAKVAASNQENQESEITVEPDDDLEEITLSVEEVHVAGEYVVEVSPQSIEDANIAAHIQSKRETHSRIRARIEERRRDQMAEIRASTAKMWEEHSSGEDLVGLIQSEGHGHNVLIEPATAEAGHVYGATLVRIDESTILKLRVPLDSGYVAVDENKVASNDLPVLPPGVPSPSELGLPDLPPPPGASGALAALRDEMAED
ncbi:MAG: hypothetical protein DWC06_06565 [Candidatus Poseidoniales archaeon]|nr:MAG: hypothetical protein DWC06_06565 [Candidatus Poseidoniales archaeon]|tara:strand:+ start:294 stop:1184 length:891 start_codon:yes stop_codon:yes gene_type:complete